MSVRWFLIGCAIAIIMNAAPSHGSTYISAGDEIYYLLSRLEAEGVITDAILSTKPLSRKEIVRLAREAEMNAVGSSEFIKELVKDLKRRVQADEYSSGTIKPVESAYAAYINTNADVLSLSYPGAARENEQAFNYNNNGDLYAQGSNYRLGMTSRLENIGPLSIYLNPEYRTTDDMDKGVLKKGYAVLGFSWLDIIVGKDSQWWGPGYHGAILLSNNAEPLTMIRLSGPSPQTLPWMLKYLGPFQYNVFFSKLEKDRGDFPEPYFWGIRLDFKPHPNIEIGFERTAVLGGRGRPTNASTWLDSLFGSNEHDTSENPGDQRAGYDLKLTLPFDIQPVQIYWEGAGEENRQQDARVPYKNIGLYGVYLPRLFGFERIDLRTEYIRTVVNRQPYVWYTHGTYTNGYTYNGMIIGHHIGTESRDIYLEGSYSLPEKGARISLACHQEKHNLEGPVSETLNECSISGFSMVSKRVEVSVLLGYGRLVNPGNAAGPSSNIYEFSSGVRYLF